MPPLRSQHPYQTLPTYGLRSLTGLRLISCIGSYTTNLKIIIYYGFK